MPETTESDLRIPSALAALRLATQAEHSALDQNLPLQRDDFGHADYLNYIARVSGWLKPLEATLWSSPWPSLADAGQRTGKLAWIEADLLEGGWSRAQVDAIPVCPYVPQASDEARRFGIAYVLEGSTLGSSFLFRRLQPRLAPLPLHWLLGYGAATGPLWKSFIRRLDEQLAEVSQVEAASAAAREAFESFNRWVVRGESA
ncbi:biliverdin-producing heme oxygenase [Pseudomonas kuykendallii]|uniref:Biliverdin-producing heme oxygenase n=1 Tax=Pseudomonas kuykendallii TaxID=1007099 RepID=A0A2W5D3B7_9PSED|nr:biliverdin-producing heme oxygenase [Pseudomonas kuykendallii]PZP26241.1 MAG: biliverdin-producing heme oxygenase [Pseudomonas kuykendallii]